MASASSNLDADWWNGVVDEIVPWAVNVFQSLTKEMLASGYPVGAQPVTPQQEYQNLTMMRDSGLTEFTASPAAQQRLAELEQQFASTGSAGTGRGGAQPLAMPMQQAVA